MRANNKSTTKWLVVASVVLNMAAFLLVIALYPPVWYTNDDYRMMTIASGAYTGIPSADVIFMKYPVGLLLSSLYKLTTYIPWYGFFTILCMFVPCCIFCYYILKKAYHKNRILVGLLLYTVLFLFFIQKYICLPQFTLTAAFLGVGAIVLIYEMPAKNNMWNILLAVFCCVLSFSVRSKAFYLLVPLILLIVIVRLITEKNFALIKSFASVALVAVVICAGVAAVDFVAYNRSEEMQYFERFNSARAQVYDYGGAPAYYDHMPFYVENGISEVTYRAMSARHLDIYDGINAQSLETVAEYIDEIRENSDTLLGRINTALKETIEYWIDSGDEVVKYSSICVFILLFLNLALGIKRNKCIYPLAVAGFILESVFLMYSGRLVVRVLDTLLLSLGVLGTLGVMELIQPRFNSFKELTTSIFSDKQQIITRVLVSICVVSIAFTGVIGLNTAVKDKYHSVAVTQNSRMNGLKAYAELYPENFYFYDAFNFISCSDYVFRTYKEGKILNHDSTGSWNVHSETYYDRNANWGFTTSIDGLISKQGNVYYVATDTLKMGITKTLKDVYNKKLQLVETIDSDNYILYIYMVVDDD